MDSSSREVSGPTASEYSVEVGALEIRHKLSVARRKVVDGIRAHYSQLKIPRASRNFLYVTAFDMMILDLAVCWDTQGKGSFVSIANRLACTNNTKLKEYLGLHGDVDRARAAASFLHAKKADLEDKLTELIAIRDKRVAHIDRNQSVPMAEVPYQSVNEVQRANQESLEKLRWVNSYFATFANDEAETAGEDLLNALRYQS